MPRQCQSVKEFLEFFKAPPVKEGSKVTPTQKTVIIVIRQTDKRGFVAKFKHKTRKGLHTLVITDKTKAKKLEQALPVNVVKRRIAKKKGAGAK